MIRSWSHFKVLQTYNSTLHCRVSVYWNCCQQNVVELNLKKATFWRHFGIGTWELKPTSSLQTYIFDVELVCLWWNIAHYNNFGDKSMPLEICRPTQHLLTDDKKRCHRCGSSRHAVLTLRDLKIVHIWLDYRYAASTSTHMGLRRSCSEKLANRALASTWNSFLSTSPLWSVSTALKTWS